MREHLARPSRRWFVSRSHSQLVTWVTFSGCIHERNLRTDNSPRKAHVAIPVDLADAHVGGYRCGLGLCRVASR